jgi:prepilin-type N-terminal cleavage/methylation domain-containing protein/prepilin-type processing-associated H-X9-DG protein
MTFSRIRSGFTFVELLVVIAIIGILVALLLPAVQAAREAARRAMCEQNLKQLAQGLHNYHDVYESFPSGYLNELDSDGNSADNVNLWGWSAMLLPYVEQGPLYALLDIGNTPLNSAAGSPALLGQMQKPIDTFRCPSDSGEDTNSHRAGFPAGGNNALATSNYAAANSSFHLEPDGGRAMEQGLFREDVGVRMADITDGTSNVIALGGRRSLTDKYPTGAAVVFGIRRRNDPHHRADQLGAGCAKINLDASANLAWSQIGFSSHHPNGANFAMADGSVRFIKDTIDFDGGDGQMTCNLNPDDAERDREVDTTWERLLAIQDGQPVGDF